MLKTEKMASVTRKMIDDDGDGEGAGDDKHGGNDNGVAGSNDNKDGIHDVLSLKGAANSWGVAIQPQY